MCYNCEKVNTPLGSMLVKDIGFYWPQKKETGMNKEQAEISRRFREALEVDAVQAEVQRRIDIMNNYGSDNWPEGTVFRFFRTFGDASRENLKQYSYAALKTSNGKWYMTGNEGVSLGGMSWREFLAWLVGHPTASIVTPADIVVSAKWSAYGDAR